MTKSEPDQALLGDISRAVAAALAEDIGQGDLSARLVPNELEVTATVVSRQDCILCGQWWFAAVFRQLDDHVECHWRNRDGELIKADSVVCQISGRARPILTGERTALNFLQLLSANATAVRTYTDAVAGTGAVILDTRKTIPGLRRAQKYAVRCGGGENHRMGLYDAILIKENHIAAAGSIEAAIEAAIAQGSDVLIQIEVESVEQAKQALTTDVHRLLLDNFSSSQLSETVKLRDRVSPGVRLEASGGVTLDNVRSVAETGVDYISVGAVTKDVAAIDFSMRFID